MATSFLHFERARNRNQEIVRTTYYMDSPLLEKTFAIALTKET